MKINDISIIIPYYNNIDGLERLLLSIGFHDNIEVIIVNDYSNKNNDKYYKLRKKYTALNSFIFYDNNTKKKGAGVARNIGLENATGKWLLFADSDDFFTNDWYNILCEYLNTDIDIIFFSPICNNNFYIVNNRAIKYKNIIYNYLNNTSCKELELRYFFDVPWSKLIRKELVDKNNIRFDETLYSNDVMFSTKIGYYAKNIVASIKEFYCVSVDNSNSLTKIKTLESFNIRSMVDLNKHKFLYSRLGNYSYLKYHPLVTMDLIIYRNYGIKTYLKYFKKYRRIGIPFIHLIPFNIYKVKYYLNRIINRLNVNLRPKE